MSEFDSYSENYEAILNEATSSFSKEQNYFLRYKVDYVKSSCRKGKVPDVILDFGCGVGLCSAIIQEQFPDSELWAYDPSAKSVLKAKVRTGLETIFSNADELPRKKFDVIFISNVFHHIPSEKHFNSMMLCKELLSKDGKIFLFEHNPYNPLTRIIFERCIFDKDATMIKRGEILSLVKQCGLSVAGSNYTLFFPRLLSLLRPVEKFLGWIPLGAQYCVEAKK